MGHRLEQLDLSWKNAAYEFCRERPIESVYVAGWIHEGGLSERPLLGAGWLLADRGGQKLRSLVFLSRTGILVPLLSGREAIDGLQAIARTSPNMIRIIVGERSQVASLWEMLRSLGFQERERRDQEVLFATKESFVPSEASPLSVATEEDLEQVVRASSLMSIEETNRDPEARNPVAFRERIRERILRGRDFIAKRDGTLIFKTNVSALSPIGGQIEGVYTVREARRQKVARSSMSWVTQWVLERSERAVLLVNRDNRPAQDLYASLGYRFAHESRTLFVSAPR